jgi:monoamine oxidase
VRVVVVILEARDRVGGRVWSVRAVEHDSGGVRVLTGDGEVHQVLAHAAA